MVFDKLSEHFDWAEVTRSDTASRKGIDNSLPAHLLPAVQRTAGRLERVRAVLDAPVHVTSWYRCLALNAFLGSKPTSKHMLGEAVDFSAPSYGSPKNICLRLLNRREVIQWDQLILEHNWVHISWNSIPNGEQRGQVLSLLNDGTYAIGLTKPSGESYVA
jgi:hypothetical protein